MSKVARKPIELPDNTKFSINANSSISLSFAFLIYAGTVFNPAILEARYLLSPDIIWYLLSSNFLTVSGCIIPYWLIDSASSFSSELLKLVLGWNGLAVICSIFNYCLN